MLRAYKSTLNTILCIVATLSAIVALGTPHAVLAIPAFIVFLGVSISFVILLGLDFLRVGTIVSDEFFGLLLFCSLCGFTVYQFATEKTFHDPNAKIEICRSELAEFNYEITSYGYSREQLRHLRSKVKLLDC